MALPTTSGSGRRGPGWGRGAAACSLSLTLLSAGCSTLDLTQKQAELETARQHLNALLHETRAQEAAIREDMAKTRIAAAKQEVDLKDLRKQVVELHQALETKQVELKSLRTERDRLLQVKTEQETQLGELARLRQTAMEAAAAQARLKELESVLAARTAELEQAKKQVGARQAKNQRKPATQAAKAKPAATESTPPPLPDRVPAKAAALPPPRPSHPPADRSDAGPVEPTLRVADVRSVQTGLTRQTVQPGDTLWAIAHQHGLTVEALKEANGLDTDVIVSGQELLIPTNPVER